MGGERDRSARSPMRRENEAKRSVTMKQRSAMDGGRERQVSEVTHEKRK